MKRIVGSVAFIVALAAAVFAQVKPKAEPMQYPFGKPGDSTRGVFGEDDRKEIKDAYEFKDYARATAVMIPKSSISGNKVYASTLRSRLTKIYGSSNFDESVKFLDQPTCANCTGFLIAPDVLVTAGHCIEAMSKAKDYVWLFDYTIESDFNANRGYFTIDPKNVYEVKEIMGAYFQNLSTYTDYSVLRLDRKSDRKPYRFRTGGNIGLFSDVNTIGSPTGLPLKLADNAYVVDNSYEKWFKNNIDGFPGNSGGPVFSPDGFIEGIHVRGAVELNEGNYVGDYKYDASCNCVKTLKFETSADNAGSHAHRITAMPVELLHTALYDNLEYAILNGDLDRLKDWLAYSWFLDADYTVNRGRLEFLAAQENNLSALRLILETTSNMNVTDAGGNSLLFYAIDNNNTEMIEYLLRKGLSPNKADSYGITPLHHAVDNGNLEVVKILLAKGANVGPVNMAGETALHNAAYTGNIDVIRVLLEKGANPKVKNNDGKTPRKVAKKNKNKAAAKYLKKAEKGKL